MTKTSFNAAAAAFLLLALGNPGPALQLETQGFSLAGSLLGHLLPTPPEASAHPPPSGSAASSRAQAEPKPWGPVQLVVYKSERVVAVYHHGTLHRQVPVVLGLVPEGTKRHAFDARTPEGLYHIVGKRRHERWQYFLALDYPNSKDRRNYEEEVRRGTIPDDNGRPFGIGDGIGLHGNDRETEQAEGVDWTKGCIALGREDIAELAQEVDVGTPVWIVK